MKITDIEPIPLRVPYEERIRKNYYHFAMTEAVTVYKFYTDTGLIGLAENVGAPFDQEVLDAYLGTNPFDHVMGEGRFNLDMACYDLMGKHLGLPAWKLMGQQVRQWVAMGWWMPCMPPQDTAAEVQVAVERGCSTEPRGGDENRSGCTHSLLPCFFSCSSRRISSTGLVFRGILRYSDISLHDDT